MPHAIDHAALVARVSERRGGGLIVSDKPNPARTAHLIVDMQNGFMEPGAPVEVPMARDIVDQINVISRAVRANGGTNIFLRYTTADGDTAWPVFMERMGGSAAAHRAAFTPGEHYWNLWPLLDVSDQDLIIEKRRFSGFTSGTCALYETLRARNIETLIVSGTLTNCCCESTVRDAMQYNFRVLIPTDANAALSDEEHEAALYSLGWIFADLATSDEIAAMLEVN